MINSSSDTLSMAVAWHSFLGLNSSKKSGIAFYLCFSGVCMISGPRARGIFKYPVTHLNSRIVYLFRYMTDFVLLKFLLQGNMVGSVLLDSVSLSATVHGKSTGYSWPTQLAEAGSSLWPTLEK